MLPVPSAIEQDKILKEQVKDQIEDVIHNQVALKQIGATSVNVHDSDQGLVVSLHEAGFFNSGSADIRPQAMDTLRAIANILPHQAMRVEGHTDDIPIHTAQFATNWELSTARAAGITRLLIAQHAVDPAEISATGYAEFHPVASNATEDGRQENRRVDIILLKPRLAGENAPAPPSPAAPGSDSKP
jgi:chemotaxis protein MotB